MSTIEQAFQTMIDDLGPGGVHEGLEAIPALQHVFQMLGSNYSEWIVRQQNPPSQGTFSVVMQRYAPGMPGDLEQKIVHGVHAVYPHNSMCPIYCNAEGKALEIDGWYVTHHAFDLRMPMALPHSEP